jgi:Domain of unknown function (DUF1877)
MGIKMSILKVSDEQIHNFIKHPNQLENLLNKTISSLSKENCFLSDFWDGLHYLLTAEMDNNELPLSALKKGDVYYSKGLSDPAHAIYNVTTRNFAKELNRLSESKLRERHNPQKILEAQVYPGRLWLFPNYYDDTFSELLGNFLSLRNFTIEAVKEDKGLIFCRYEDW